MSRRDEPEENRRRDGPSPASTPLPRNCGELTGPPPFEPAKWDDQTNLYNNCYNYAVNIVTGKSSWPGQWKGDDGHTYLDKDRGQVMTCEYVAAGCVLDGLGRNAPDDVNVSCPPRCHLIALFIRPHKVGPDGTVIQQGDFHFARKDQDGKWSHKEGTLGPTKILKDNKPISDPRDYLERDHPGQRPEAIFCGTFCVCWCTANIEKEGDRTAWEDQHN